MVKIPDMSLYDVAWQISDLLETNKAVYLKTLPEAPDFTAAAPFKAVIWGQRSFVEIDVTPQNVMDVIALFDATIFDPKQVERLYVWNLKSLCSYFHFYVRKFIQPQSGQVLLDLKPIEGFLGIRKTQPENLVECVNRVRQCLQFKGWQALYKSVHLPLTLKVLPAIETRPLLNEVAKRTEHPYYEIEGQTNGRMNCLKKFAKCYLPHNMGPDVRKALKPRGYGVRFLYADFHNCEICVLQWLTGDPVLKDLLTNGKDLYAQFYELITGDACDSDVKRKKAKGMLIAVIYGSGAKGLAEMLSVPEGVGAELIRRIHDKFPVACRWLDEQQEKAKHGIVTDYFGRPRKFEDKESYLARNFSVQGVAATVCQEKLIELNGALDERAAEVVFSVHDGYGLIVKVEAARKTYKLVKQVLESESKLCPGLSMKVEIKFGAKLDAMKVLWKD